MSVPSSQYVGHEQLLRVEACLNNYNQSIIKRVIEHKPELAQKILDFGAGIGTLAVELEKKTGLKPDTLELDPMQREILSKRGFRALDHIETGEKYDFIYSSNVLEHIDKDLETVKILKSHLKPQGLLLLYLPAFNLLWSDMDTQVGHFRRYNKANLHLLLNQAGLAIKRSEYCDFLGFFASLFLKFSKAEISESPKSLSFYDRIIFPLSHLLDKLGGQYLLGKNIFVVAQNSN